MADISAARLNNLQARVELILGNGAGESGYGQDGTTGYGDPVSSFPVDKTTDVVQAEHINNIYADILRCKIHQGGPSSPDIRQVIENLTVVAEETSYNVNEDGITSADPEGVFKGIADYERIMDGVEVDKFLIHPTQGTLSQAATSVRTNTWNGLIFHEVTVTFNDADHRRHFFNTGGELRFSANNSNSVLGKGLDWSTLLRDIGTVVFNHNSTVSTGDGNGTSIGNYDLTAAFQTVYEKTGTGTYSNVYAGNLYRIKARTNDENVIIFRIEFYDIVVDGATDDNVDGRLESIVQEYRSTGDVVSVPAPVYFNSTTLSVFGDPDVGDPGVYVPVY
jgi:hypothetical protein